MKTWQAILLTIFIAIFLHSSFVPDFITPLVIIGSAFWIAYDSKIIQLQKYKSNISYSPLVMFICTILLWIAAFPWYLSVRYKIKHGLLPLKESASV